MADISTVWAQTNGDWQVADGALLSGDDLTTAVLISCFTDQTAGTDDIIPDAVPDQAGDPRGWWGDLGADKPIGSLVWLYNRAKQTADTLAGVQDALTSALQWLIDDGVVASLQVDCTYPAAGRINAVIQLYRQDGSTTAVSFSAPWQGAA